MKYFPLALASCFVLFSCKKDNNNSNQSTKTQLLTTGSWKYDSGGADLDHNGSIDLTLEFLNAVPSCLLDNIVTFKTDGSGVNDEGASKCDPSSPQTTSFNWNFVNNENAVNISGSGFAGASGQFQIKELSSTKFTFTKDTTFNNIPATLIVNLKH